MDRSRLAKLLARERATFAGRHPGPARAYQRAGSLVTDVDGLEYADFSLGDTAAMAEAGAELAGHQRRGRGPAQAWSAPFKNGLVSIAGKPSATVKPQTEASILKQAGLRGENR